MITKRTFLKGAASLPLAGVLGGTAAAAGTKLTGATYLTPNYASIMWGFKGFVDRLQEGGSEVVFYDSGTLLGAAELVSGLRSGVIDFMFHTTSYINRSFPILGITGLPYVVDALYRNPERLAVGSPLFKLIQEEIAKQNLHLLSLGGGILQPDYLWSDTAKIDTLEGVSGKRIRVAGLDASTAMEKLGAAVVSLPSSELYLAIQRGTIDGIVANAVTIDGRKLQEQTKTAFKLPISANAQGLFVLKSRWDALDEGTRNAVDSAAQWYDQNAARHINEDDIPNVWPAFEKEGLTVVEPSAEQMQQFRSVCEPIWETWKTEVGEEVGTRALQLALGEGSE